jgi:ankyrin repeat protein
LVWGSQYQDHNPRPGPVYDGTGYTRMSKAIQKGAAAVEALLNESPEAVHEVSTGGATPLHMCGMSRNGQMVTALIIARGGHIEAKDTYGFTPLHRMASNNLAVGARALLDAGADPNAAMQGMTALMIAQQSHARDVIHVLREHLAAAS